MSIGLLRFSSYESRNDEIQWAIVNVLSLIIIIVIKIPGQFQTYRNIAEVLTKLHKEFPPVLCCCLFDSRKLLQKTASVIISDSFEDPV